MNDFLTNLGENWLWIAGVFLLAVILWVIIKAVRERNPTRRNQDSSPGKIPGELSEDNIKKKHESGV